MAWRKVYGYDVLAEGGVVKRGTKNGATVYPYRWNGRGWSNVAGDVSLAALRAGMKRGTMRMI